jgi:histidyl-tRNA synthetase
VHQGDDASRLAFRVAEGLRDQGMNVLLHCGGGSFKSQMKKADGSGAPLPSSSATTKRRPAKYN